MGMPGRMKSPARALQARLLHGSPREDERTRHARSGGVLLMLGGAAGIGLLPLLPARIDHWLALGLACACILLGFVLPWLPFHQWPRWALLAPVAAALPVVFVGGGVVDGSLDYYSLFLPLVFIYLGLTFPPLYSSWTFALCLGGLGLALAFGQSAEAIPFVLLGSVLSAVCGLVLAVQRRAEARGYEAMRALVEAATLLGAATDREHVADVVAAAAAELLHADGVEVLLLFDDPVPAAVVAREGEPFVADDEKDLTPLARTELVLRTLAGAQTAASRAGATSATGEHRLTVAISGPVAPQGAIVVSPHNRAQGADRFAARSLELLAGEAGRVLERLRMTEQLVQTARTDPLTGLGNRAVLQEALEASTAGDIFILMDLDHFKRINDTLGHAAGDQVLVGFAEVLRGATRLNQVVTRYGGEEFAIVLPQADDEALVRHLHDVRVAWSTRRTAVTFSSGSAVRRPGESAQQALERADRALYRAKANGRDQDSGDVRPSLGGEEPALELVRQDP